VEQIPTKKTIFGIVTIAGMNGDGDNYLVFETEKIKSRGGL